jgi:hypothetical protein
VPPPRPHRHRNRALSSRGLRSCSEMDPPRATANAAPRRGPETKSCERRRPLHSRARHHAAARRTRGSVVQKPLSHRADAHELVLRTAENPFSGIRLPVPSKALRDGLDAGRQHTRSVLCDLQDPRTSAPLACVRSCRIGCAGRRRSRLWAAGRGAGRVRDRSAGSGCRQRERSRVQSGSGWERTPSPWTRSARVRANSMASMVTCSPEVPCV